MIKGFCLLLLFLCVGLIATAQTKDETRLLEPSQSVEREIAGGESHSYPVKLSAGQFMRVTAAQKGANVVIAIAGPDSKELWEANFTNNFGGQESLSFESTSTGEYSIILRPSSATAKKGSYEVRLELKTAATAEDKKRIEAERMVMDGIKSVRASNFQPAIEKATQVLPLWRELGDVYWEADTLALLGSAHNAIRKFDQAIAYYNQVLALRRQIRDRAGESNALEQRLLPGESGAMHGRRCSISVKGLKPGDVS